MALDEPALAAPAAFTAEVRDDDGTTVLILAGEINPFAAGALRENAPAVRVGPHQGEVLGLRASAGSLLREADQKLGRHILTDLRPRRASGSTLMLTKDLTVRPT